VIATTGLSPQQTEDIQKATSKTAVFSSANMSLGVSLLAELAKKAAAVLGTSFDVEIIEKHHNQKIDAPSGTALMLANAVKEGLPYEPQYVYDRHAVRQKRTANEIGFRSIRGGTIVGEHDVLFAGHDECITLSHSATSKGVFATGAVNAALFLAGKPAGYYTMKDLVANV
jgi:4-hydroxy-tetrahydrodipicolinate reductase